MNTSDTSGQFEEALGRLHASGPERLGRLTNHAPMVVEALAAHGRSNSVHRCPETVSLRRDPSPRPEVERYCTGALPEGSIVSACPCPN